MVILSLVGIFGAVSAVSGFIVNTNYLLPLLELSISDVFLIECSFVFVCVT